MMCWMYANVCELWVWQRRKARGCGKQAPVSAVRRQRQVGAGSVRPSEWRWTRDSMTQPFLLRMITSPNLYISEESICLAVIEWSAACESVMWRFFCKCETLMFMSAVPWPCFANGFRRGRILLKPNKAYIVLQLVVGYGKWSSI